MDRILTGWENLKNKHGQHCYIQRKQFYPFSLSVDGIMGQEAHFVLATLSQLMAVKTDEPILNVEGWVTGWIEIAVLRLYYQVLCRA